MAEYARSRDGAGTLYQWVDAERVMILDAVTGEPQRFGPRHDSIGLLKDALEHVTSRIGWEGRLVIVRLQAICGFKIDTKVNDSTKGD